LARKILRIAGTVRPEDVDNEAKATTAILKAGRHVNIIEFFEHGWLRGENRVYYIDMELADITLSDYIACFRTNQVPSLSIHQPEFLHPSDALPFDARLVNALEICRHLACGLEFLHFHECVHRDVKPSNGSDS
jgi:serine/threonine protein kinase